MKGTIFIRDQSGNERYIEVDLEKNGENIDELFAGIIKELRKDEEVISWGDVKQHLKDKGIRIQNGISSESI